MEIRVVISEDHIKRKVKTQKSVHDYYHGLAKPFMKVYAFTNEGFGSFWLSLLLVTQNLPQICSESA